MQDTPFRPNSAILRGFTIIEIMVASLVMALLVSGIISITVNFIKSYNNASAKLSSNYVARSVLDIMERDLESAVFRNNSSVWMVVEYQRSNLGTNMSNGNFPLGTGGSSGIYFFSTPQDGDPDFPGAVSAMSYSLSQSRPLRGVGQLPDGAAALYRNIETPRETFDTILDGAAYDDILQIDASVSALQSDIRYVDSDRADYYLTDSVHDLSIRLYVNEIADAPIPNDGPYILVPDGNARIAFPFVKGNYYKDSNVDGIPDNSAIQQTETTILAPDFIEIDIRVLSDDLKQLLEIVDGGFTTLSQTQTKEEISKGIESFHKRIQIYSGSL